MAVGPSGRTESVREGEGEFRESLKRARNTEIKKHTMRADVGVALAGPGQGGGGRVGQVEVVEPVLAGVVEAAGADGGGEVVGPAAGGGVGRALARRHAAADELLGDAGVPDVVQVEVGAVEEDADAVAAAGDVLGVQRLVDVADEVDDELGGLLAVDGAQLAGGVDQPRGVVVQGGDDAALGLAVARQVDVAARRRAVLGVDEVEGPREVAPLGVADAVGPRGHAGEVVVGLVVQQRLEVGRRVGGHKAAGDVGDGDVAKA